MPLQKLSEIEEKLQKDYIDIKHRYIKLKRCKYALLILKTSLISLSIGLSFINYRKYKRALPRVALHNERPHIPGLLKGRM